MHTLRLALLPGDLGTFPELGTWHDMGTFPEALQEQRWGQGCPRETSSKAIYHFKDILCALHLSGYVLLFRKKKSSWKTNKAGGDRKGLWGVHSSVWRLL